MAPNNKKSTNKKQMPRTDNVLEALRDIGEDGFNSIKTEAASIPQDFFNQLFGYDKPKPKASGDIMPGQSIEFSQAIEEQKEENQILRAKYANEQRLRQEEKSLVSQKSQEIRAELNTLVQEVSSLAATTKDLAKETQIAVMQAPVNPGIYHIVFFERLREFIKSFRKRIESASIWMQSYNQRASKKKGFWGQVGKSGSKRLLSSEDYLQRSAG